MIGKNSFYDDAVRVPLLVRGSSGAAGVIRNELVELHDITAAVPLDGRIPRHASRLAEQHRGPR